MSYCTSCSLYDSRLIFGEVRAGFRGLDFLAPWQRNFGAVTNQSQEVLVRHSFHLFSTIHSPPLLSSEANCPLISSSKARIIMKIMAVIFVSRTYRIGSATFVAKQDRGAGSAQFDIRFMASLDMDKDLLSPIDALACFHVRNKWETLSCCTSTAKQLP